MIEQRSQLRTPQPINVTLLTTSAATLFTVPSGADFLLQSLIASNLTMVTDVVSVHFIPSGDSAALANKAFEVSVSGNSSENLIRSEHSVLLPEGTTVQAFSGASNSITVFGWGYEVRGAYG